MLNQLYIPGTNPSLYFFAFMARCYWAIFSFSFFASVFISEPVVQITLHVFLLSNIRIKIVIVSVGEYSSFSSLEEFVNQNNLFFEWLVELCSFLPGTSLCVWKEFKLII